MRVCVAEDCCTVIPDTANARRTYCSASCRGRQYGKDQPERRRAAVAKWRAAHPEASREMDAKWYAANADRKRAYISEWRRENPDKRRAGEAKRRARKAEVPHVPYARSEIFTRWGGSCCYCNAPAEHLDHVTPISRGGADAEPNLVPACATCNLTKHAKTLAEWAETF